MRMYRELAAGNGELSYNQPTDQSLSHRPSVDVYPQRVCFSSLTFVYLLSTLDKQHICVNTQLKSSKKQLK